MLGEERQVFRRQLILQCFGRRRHDNGLTRQHRRHEIGQCLAGAGPGLHDQRTTAVDRCRHEVGHFDLAGTILGAIERSRDRRELFGDVGHRRCSCRLIADGISGPAPTPRRVRRCRNRAMASR